MIDIYSTYAQLAAIEQMPRSNSLLWDLFVKDEGCVEDDKAIYQVLQAHTSAAEWAPDASPSLYKQIGVTEDGYPEWVQPLGASDAYNTGDVVSYNGTLYKSTIDGNVWAPDAYPDGWDVVE